MVSIIGIGIGDPQYLTLEALDRLKACDCLIGSKRQLENMEPLISASQVCLSYTRLDHLKGLILEALSEKKPPSIGLLASGDPLFYGITPWFKRTFPDEPVHIIGGMTSLQMLFNKCQVPMHDVYLTSAHGRDFKLERLLSLPLVGILTDQKWTPYQLAQVYLTHGYNPQMIIGEHLGQADEMIRYTDAQSVQNINYKMNVVIIKNERS